jgi:4-amino-4-deoxy-L-arabinose transferase-like glycosyltransferase
MNKTNKLSLIVLFLAILVGAFFRFYKLGVTPRGFYLDEAAMGYDAYSVLKTGKDEFGMPYPIIFRSFLDFKTPIYTYLIIPLIPLMDLTPFSVRFPSALFGVLTLPLLYFLLKKLTSDPDVPLVATIFLAISPWHIIFSRTAYETNIALFFLLLGTYLFLSAIKRPWFFVVSAVSFAISFTAYHAERIVVPALVLSLAVYFFKDILQNFKNVAIPAVISILIGLILVLPTVKLMKTPGFLSRATTLNIFSYKNQMPWGYKKGNTNIEKILNTPQLLSIKEFGALYTSYFSPRYLFSIGDSGPRSSYPDFGTFFWWQFPLYLVGLYVLIKEIENKELKVFILALLFASPIPAALTRDPYSTIRSLPMVIPLIIIMSLGAIKIYQTNFFSKSKITSYLLVLILVASCTKFYISVFHFNDYFRSQHWDFGWKPVTDAIKELEDPNLPILVDNSRGEAYIHLLFFLKFDPDTYQNSNFEVPLTEYYTNMTRNLTKNMGKITVKNLEWGNDTMFKEQYIIADGMAVSEQQAKDHNMTILDEFIFPNRDVAFRILKTNPKKNKYN